MPEIPLNTNISVKHSSLTNDVVLETQSDLLIYATTQFELSNFVEPYSDHTRLLQIRRILDQIKRNNLIRSEFSEKPHPEKNEVLVFSENSGVFASILGQDDGSNSVEIELILKEIALQVYFYKIDEFDGGRIRPWHENYLEKQKLVRRLAEHLQINN